MAKKPRTRRKDASMAPPAKRSFAHIMDEATRDMPRYRQLFSRFIHLKVVASASLLLGATLARPHAILFGAIASFTLTLITYLLSKNLGYSLSGFEAIGAFCIGWVAGTIFDIVSMLVKRRS